MARPRSITAKTPYRPARGILAGRVFTSTRQYESALARALGFASAEARKRARTKAAFRSTAKRGPRAVEAEGKHDALQVLAMLRASPEISLSEAARSLGRTPETLKRYLGATIKKAPNGRYVATTSDRLTVQLRVLTTEGYQTATTRSSAQRRRVNAYKRAVDAFAGGSGAGVLEPFEGMGVQIGDRWVPVLTDPDAVRLLVAGGEIDPASPYDLGGVEL